MYGGCVLSDHGLLSKISLCLHKLRVARRAKNSSRSRSLTASATKVLLLHAEALLALEKDVAG